jgi:protocatechuate 3,4-dioxygenase beta subunit
VVSDEEVHMTRRTARLLLPLLALCVTVTPAARTPDGQAGATGATAPRPQQPARDLAASPTGRATISGVVLADDASGRPVRRATVALRGNSLPSGRIGLTDDEGRFVMTELPGGRYSLLVSKPGWVAGYHGAAESWKGPGKPISVVDGEHLSDLTLRIAPGAVITGRIFNQHGQPQPGARVMALQRRRVGGQEMLTRVGSTALQTTDDRGMYRLFGLPPGEFVVGANITTGPRTTTTLTTPEEVRWAEQLARAGPGGAGQPPPHGPAIGYSPVFYPGVTDAGAAADVGVGIGEERSNVDFQLQFVTTSTVSGTLQVPGAVEPRGVMLMLVPATGVEMSASMLGGFPMGRAPVNARGEFRFESVQAGDYTITARASSQPPPARGRGAGRAGGPPAQPVMDLWATERVTVAGQDVSGLTVVLQPGVTLSGRVAFAGSSLEPPTSLSAISIRLVAADATPSVTVGVPIVRPEEDGTFTMPGVAPGRYVMSASIPRRPGAPDLAWVPFRASIGGRNALDEPFDLPAGADIDDVVVEFTDRSAEIHGTITDGAGRPVPDLTLIVIAGHPDRWLPALASRFQRTAQPDDEGRFRLPLLPPGDYYLAALGEMDQADLRDPAYLEQLAANAIPITLAPGEKREQNIQLGTGGGSDGGFEEAHAAEHDVAQPDQQGQDDQQGPQGAAGGLA